MKLNKTLLINGEPFGLVKDHVFLDLSTPGRASFTVKSKVPLKGLVQFSIGAASGSKMFDFFTGYIERSNTVDGAQQSIFCRELSAVLWQIIPVSIRNCSMTDILGIYNRKTGLSFITGNSEYATTLRPVFQTVGNGIHGMDSMGAVFGISNYIWQQQADGKVFAGDWHDSKWADKPFSIGEHFFEDVQINGAKTVQAVPGLRPGVLLNGEYVNSLEFKDHVMVIKCGKRLDV